MREEMNSPKENNTFISESSHANSCKTWLDITSNGCKNSLFARPD